MSYTARTTMIKLRQSEIESHGVTVLRFKNEDVINSNDGSILTTIKKQIEILDLKQKAHLTPNYRVKFKSLKKVLCSN